MATFEIVVSGLALWRIVSLITRESGPWGIFRRVRELVGINHDSEGIPDEWPGTFLGELISCEWCLSLFLAIPYAVLWAFIDKRLVLWISIPFALSAIVIVLERIVNGEF